MTLSALQLLNLSYLWTGHTLETRRGSAEGNRRPRNSDSMMKEFCNRDEKLPSISFSPEPWGLQPASGSSSHAKIPENLLPGVVQVKMKQLETIIGTTRQQREGWKKIKWKSLLSVCMLEQSVLVWSLVFQLSLSLSSFSRLVKFFLLWRRRVLAWKNVGNADWERLAWWGTLTERERKREVTSHVQLWGLGIHVQWLHAPQRDNVENYRKATGSGNVYQFTSNTDKSKMYFHFCFNFSFAFSNHVVNEWITAVKIHFGLSRQTG